jgi:IS1 family transposase
MVFHKKKECDGEIQQENGKIIGRVWIWTAIDAPIKLLICHNIGNRELEDARNHLRCIYSRIVGTPLFVSDKLSHYGVILKDLNHTLVPFESTGKKVDQKILF